MKRIPVDDVAASVGQPGQEAIVALMLDQMHPHAAGWTATAGPTSANLPLARHPRRAHLAPRHTRQQQTRERAMQPPLMKRLGAELLGTFWLVLGGAGTAVFGITSSTPRQVTTFGWSSAALEATKAPRS